MRGGSGGAAGGANGRDAMGGGAAPDGSGSESLVRIIGGDNLVDLQTILSYTLTEGDEWKVKPWRRAVHAIAAGRNDFFLTPEDVRRAVNGATAADGLLHAVSGEVVSTVFQSLLLRRAVLSLEQVLQHAGAAWEPRVYGSFHSRRQRHPAGVLRRREAAPLLQRAFWGVASLARQLWGAGEAAAAAAPDFPVLVERPLPFDDGAAPAAPGAVVVLDQLADLAAEFVGSFLENAAAEPAGDGGGGTTAFEELLTVHNIVPFATSVPAFLRGKNPRMTRDHENVFVWYLAFMLDEATCCPFECGDEVGGGVGAGAGGVGVGVGAGAGGVGAGGCRRTAEPAAGSAVTADATTARSGAGAGFAVPGSASLRGLKLLPKYAPPHVSALDRALLQEALTERSLTARIRSYEAQAAKAHAQCRQYISQGRKPAALIQLKKRRMFEAAVDQLSQILLRLDETRQLRDSSSVIGASAAALAAAAAAVKTALPSRESVERTLADHRNIAADLRELDSLFAKTAEAGAGACPPATEIIDAEYEKLLEEAVSEIVADLDLPQVPTAPPTLEPAKAPAPTAQADFQRP